MLNPFADLISFTFFLLLLTFIFYGILGVVKKETVLVMPGNGVVLVKGNNAILMSFVFITIGIMFLTMFYGFSFLHLFSKLGF